MKAALGSAALTWLPAPKNGGKGKAFAELDSIRNGINGPKLAHSVESMGFYIKPEYRCRRLMLVR